MITVQLLPPKMAKIYATKAKNGEADTVVGDSAWIFNNQPGGYTVTIVCLDPPAGNMRKQKAVKSG